MNTYKNYTTHPEGLLREKCYIIIEQTQNSKQKRKDGKAVKVIRMKKYTEMTAQEIMDLANKDGDQTAKINEMVKKHLDSLNLSQEAQSIIAQTDINVMAACFGGLFTEKEVEEFILENYRD